jgi:sugar/nucleoside kinase (ribokinase family)
MYLVVGTTTVDIFLTGMERIPFVGGDEFTPESYAFLDDPVQLILGGNGANSAYVFATLGQSAGLCSVIGNDELGAIARRWLMQRNIDLKALLQSSRWATAGTAIAMDRAMRRLSLHHPGRTFEYSPEDISKAMISRAHTVLITSYHLLRAFRPHGCAEIFATAKQAGARTAIDIGPVVPPLATMEELRTFLPVTDYLIANAYELRSCLGGQDIEETCGLLLEAGASTVVIKEGAAGSKLFTEQGRIEAPAFTVSTDFTVGAGDSFNAGFLAAVDQGLEPRQALRFANAVAALVVAAKNGVLGSPTLDQVRELLRRH